MPEHTPAPTPSRAVYGFVLFLCSKTLFLLYLIWALIPEEWFEEMNITYLPQRYWAVAIPIFLLTVLAMFAFIIYPSLSLCMTPSVDDIRIVMEKVEKQKKNEKLHCFSNEYDLYDDKECICKEGANCLKKDYIKAQRHSYKYYIPMVEDMCIADVSRTLYLK